MSKAKDKGSEGEREVVDFLNRFFKSYLTKGIKFIKNVASGGLGVKGDIIGYAERVKRYTGPPHMWHNYLTEVKFTEKINLPKDLKQAYREAGIEYPANSGSQIPLVVHRREDKGEESWPMHTWHVTLPFKDFCGLILDNLEIQKEEHNG